MLAFSYQKEPQQRLGACSIYNLNACVKRLEMEDSQVEAFRTYSLILAGTGGSLPLLLTLTAYSVLGLVVLEAACGSAGGQWCGSLCQLLCSHHTSAPRECQVMLDGSLPQLLQ